MPDSAYPNQYREGGLRILIMRFGGIGDVVMTSPAPRALRDAFPDAYIAWLVDPRTASLVTNHPDVDEIIIIGQSQRPLPWYGGNLLPPLREIMATARDLRRRHFDVVLDFQGSCYSGLLAVLSAAPRRIGFRACSRQCPRVAITEQVERPRQGTHYTQADLALLAPLGITIQPMRPVLEIPEHERTSARAFLAHQGLTGEPYAACCIAAAYPQKDWVWSRWGELSDLLWEREGLRTVFIGGPERRADSLRLVEGRATPPVIALGHASLAQSTALVQDAAIVVGCDTGISYVGLATHTPTVLLYGATDASWLADESQVAACFHPLPCSPCSHPRSCAHNQCMQAITAVEVADTAHLLLQRIRVTA